MNREERISNYNDRLLKVIDEQLLKVNLELMKDVENLVYQKSLTEIIKLLKDKKISSEQLVAYYLMRIKKFDQSPKGNNAICELNPFAIDEAKLCDISDSDFILKGIPVLIKDNINTNNMPTSAGTIALKDFTPQNNATVVEELKKNNAIQMSSPNQTPAPSLSDCLARKTKWRGDSIPWLRYGERRLVPFCAGKSRARW